MQRLRNQGGGRHLCVVGLPSGSQDNFWRKVCWRAYSGAWCRIVLLMLHRHIHYQEADYYLTPA